MESQSWDRGEGCGTDGSSLGHKGDKFGNSKEMEYHRQYCRGLGDHGSCKGTASCIVGTWLVFVKDLWVMRLERFR